MKEGLQALNAYQVASIRMIGGGLVLLPFLPRALKRVPREKLGIMLLSGLLGSFFPAYLFCLAETRLDSALAGIMNALTPLFTLGVGVLFFQAKISRLKWLGVILGFAGLVLLILAGGQTIDFTYVGFASFILLATLLYGINVNLVNKHLHHIASLDIATIAFSFLILPGALVLWISGFPGPEAYSRSWVWSVGASAILGMLGTALASVLFYVLLKKAGPVFASMVTYGIPFVALGWGLLAGETIQFLQVCCLGLILAGVYLARK